MVADVAKLGVDESGVQARGQPRDLAGGLLAAAACLGTALPQHGGNDLFDQTDLALGGAADRAQVPGLEPERGELSRGTGDQQRVGVEGRSPSRDQSVRLEIGEQVVGDAGRLEQGGREQPDLTGFLGGTGNCERGAGPAAGKKAPFRRRVARAVP